MLRAKVVETIAAMMNNCAAYHTNLKVETHDPTAVSDKLSYEQTLQIVMPWGTDKFVAFVENARLAKSDGDPLTVLQQRCITCQKTLMEAVKLRQDADEAIVTLGSERQQTECPHSYEEGASAYARAMEYFTWDNVAERFMVVTLDQFVDKEHLLSALVLLGVGKLGKSKLVHQIAQELCIAYGYPQYVFLKAIDPLGILSHSGELRKSGCLCLTDFDFAASRGKAFGPEAMKSLLDVPEGGTIKDTRWRPASIRRDLPRLIALNGSPGRYGTWFLKNDQYGISIMVDALANVSAGRGTLAEAAKKMKELDADEQAAARRALIGVATESLITGETVRALQADTQSKASAGVAARKAYWASRNA